MSSLFVVSGVSVGSLGASGSSLEFSNGYEGTVDCIFSEGDGSQGEDGGSLEASGCSVMAYVGLLEDGNGSTE